MIRFEPLQLSNKRLFCSFVLVFLVHPVAANPPVRQESLSLQALAGLSDDELAKVDIAALNLAAAEGLPGSENINRMAVLRKLDAWAARIAEVTANKAHFFESNPDYYENSWGKFCSIMLVLTMKKDFQVHYNVEQRTNPSLAKSKDQFIHGIVAGTGGTCASLPVAFVAVGRRLGYPLRLVQTWSHFYARWDDPTTGERFNIEGSNLGGLDFPDEDEYEERLDKWRPRLPETGNYLKSMSPREELSSFLATRADCLRENGRWVEAYMTYKKAVELAAQNLFAAELLSATGRALKRMHHARQAEIAYERHERRRRSDPRLMLPGIPNIPTAHPASRRQPYAAAHAHAVLFQTSGVQGRNRTDTHPFGRGIPATNHFTRHRPNAGSQAYRIAFPSPGTDEAWPYHSWTPLDAIIAIPHVNSIMPEFEARIEAQNRRTEALARFIRPVIHNTNQHPIRGTPHPHIPNWVVSPIAPPSRVSNPVAAPAAPQRHIPNYGVKP